MMEAVEAHLAINHLPVLGLPFAAGLLAAGVAFDNAEWRRAGLWTAALAGAAAWAAAYSGELAADAAGGLAGVSDRAVAAHAAAAWSYVWAASLAGASAAAVLAAYGRHAPRRAAAAVLALGLCASAVGGWAAHRGGLIRHAELR